MTHSPAAGAVARPKPYPASGAARPPRSVPGFSVIKEVGNFEVVDPANKPVKATSKVKLTVDYTANEIGQVNNDKRKLKLGVYLGGQWRIYHWNQLTDLGDANDYSSPGSIEVEIEGDLSDPPLAWGGG
jgi:hypothetical protein